MKDLIKSLGVPIGIIMMAFGCLLDFSMWGIGTFIRGILGLFGAFLLLSKNRNGLGGVVFLMVGLIGYIYTIQSGVVLNLDDLFKDCLRMGFAITMVLGYKSVAS